MRLRTVKPYVSPGFGRSAGGPPQYTSPDRRAVPAADRVRADALIIPPAWTEVWISRAANGHIQAVGVDAAGRRQYLYHDHWRVRRDHAKFDRARQLAAALPQARGRVTRDLQAEGLARERVLATAFRILDTMAVRVGNTQYLKDNGSHGLSTLQRRHAAVDGAEVTLAFPAKSGKKARVHTLDEDLARVIRELTAGPARAALLSWGEHRQPVSASEVNAYVKKQTGADFTAKDFRTLKGTITAARYLAGIGPESSRSRQKTAIRDAVRAVAEVLGNTPTVALRSYIDPEVITRYRLGEVIATRSSPERALLELLDVARKANG